METRARTAATATSRYSGLAVRDAEREVDLQVIGGLHVSCAGRTVRIPATGRRLLVFLAVSDAPKERCYVAGLLWPTVCDERARGSLRTALWQLRRVGLPLVDGDDGSLSLSPGVRVDLHDVTEISHRLIEDPLQASLTDCRCRKLYADVLPDWHDDWLLFCRERFLDLRLHALEVVCERLASLGHFGEAIQAGLAAVAAEPLRESSHRALIRAHWAEGNIGAAVRQFESFQTLLRDELGADPSHRMNGLMRCLYAGRLGQERHSIAI